SPAIPAHRTPFPPHTPPRITPPCAPNRRGRPHPQTLYTIRSLTFTKLLQPLALSTFSLRLGCFCGLWLQEGWRLDGRVPASAGIRAEAIAARDGLDGGIARGMCGSVPAIASGCWHGLCLLEPAGKRSFVSERHMRLRARLTQ